MSKRIARSARIHPGAEIGSDVEIGDDCRIDCGVRVGDHTRLGDRASLKTGVTIGRSNTILEGAVIKGRTSIGDHNTIHEYAVLGGEPLIASQVEENGSLSIGSNNVIREMCTIQVGSTAGAATTIGNHNFLMPNSQVGHDSTVQDHVTLTNYCGLCGHVFIGNGAVLGVSVSVHQHVRIGELAMVGASAYVSQDIPPFTLVDGRSGKLMGLNRVGLRRAGVSEANIAALKDAYRTAFRANYPRREIDFSLGELVTSPLVDRFTQFIKSSVRGLPRDRRKSSSIQQNDVPARRLRQAG